MLSSVQEDTAQGHSYSTQFDVTLTYLHWAGVLYDRTPICPEEKLQSVTVTSLAGVEEFTGWAVNLI